MDERFLHHVYNTFSHFILQFWVDTENAHIPKTPLDAVIGPALSDVALPVANLIKLFNLPQVSRLPISLLILFKVNDMH